MKRVIKKLSVVFILLTLLLPTIVMAADLPKVKLELSDTPKAVNDQFKAKFYLTDDVKANADFNLAYDSNMLEVVDDGLKAVKDTMTLATVDSTEAGVLKYVNIDNAGVTVTFKVKKEGDSKISLSIPDMYLYSIEDKVEPSELSSLKGEVQVSVKKAVEEKKEDTKNTTVDNTKKQENQSNSTSTSSTSTEKKGFVSQFFEKISNDWILKVLFIAICLIFLILIIMLIEYVIVSRKKKNQDDDANNNEENLKVSRPEDYRSQVRGNNQNINNTSASTGVEDISLKINRPRRPLTEEERRKLLERRRQLIASGQAPKLRRPLTEEQRKILIERAKKRRAQEANNNAEKQERQVKLPNDRNDENQ